VLTYVFMYLRSYGIHKTLIVVESFLKIAAYEKEITNRGFGFLRFIKESVMPPGSLRPCTDHKPEQLHPLTFIVIYGNHFNQLKPIADVLVQKDMDFSVIYVQKRIYCEHKDAYKDQILINSIFTLGCYYSAVVRQWGMLLRSLLCRMVKPMSSESDMQVILHHYKQYYMLKCATKRVLDGYSGKLILFKAEGFIARTIITECREKGTPTYTIQHGLINTHDMFKGIQVDNYLVWSDYFASVLRNSKAKANIIPVGCASMDVIFAVAKKAEPIKHYIKRDSLNLLFLPNSGHSHTTISQVILGVDICMAFAASNSKTHLTVKPHPGDVNDNVISHINAYYDRLNNVTLHHRGKEIPFDGNDITVINNSATGMESAIWGRPIIIVAANLTDVQVPFYLDEHIAEFAYDLSSFNCAVDNIIENYSLYSEKCRKFAGKYYANHGHAVEKILNVIL